ncbi:MAG TPA: Rieske (2Fe-2S) protein [Microbacteriaceae bacterium]
MNHREPGAGGALTRRALIAAAGTATGSVLLTACSSGGTGSSGAGGSGAGGSGAGGSGSGTNGVFELSSIPVGGGRSGTFHGSPIVLEQPKAGTVVAFSAICPHQGCVVAPAGARFDCPCHGSVFDGATGAVEHGPAPKGLTALTATVNGSSVTVS